MIKFFRKIRKKMLTNSNFSKYFIYAVGEIVLVVIGILIALAISEWNNNQKIKSEEIATLKKLVKDLESDKIRYYKNIEFYTEFTDVLGRAKSIIFKESLSDNEIKEVMYYQGAIHKDLNPRRTTYDEMVNSGRIYNLSNDSLVDNIIAYYQFLDESIYENKEQRKEFRALFYGPDFSDFWFWKADDDPFPNAKVFFSDNDSPAYRKLKQSAGWSEYINADLLNNNNELIKINGELIEMIYQNLNNKK